MAPQEAFKVAAVEFNPELFEFDRNLIRVCGVIEEAATNEARLIVMPEAALSGYIYRDLEQFLPYMDVRCCSHLMASSSAATARLTSTRR
jgi:predicted amidohydrolase